MDNSQKINCTVGSCKYNDHLHSECILQAIQVSPQPNVNTQKADESMCSSYNCEQ